jgi:hypothetical protein
MLARSASWIASRIERLDGPKTGNEGPGLTSRPSEAGTRYGETVLSVVLFGGLILLLSWPAFNGFFYGEDFLWMGAYRLQHANFLRTIFTPLYGLFYRPAGAAWELGTQLLLPWDPVMHHARNFLFALADLFLLHRIMLRVTSSRIARGIGLAFFALSKAHLVIIGMFSTIPTLAGLTHFLLCLLFLLRHLQERKWTDYGLALGFFVLSVFSRDYSLVLIAVVLALFVFSVYGKGLHRMAIREAVVKFGPFVVAVCGYLVARFLAVGVPPVRQDSLYGINPDFVRLAKGAIIFAGNLLNLSLSSIPQLTGLGDLSTLLTDNPSVHQAYKIAFLVLGCVLLLWTTTAGILRKKWYSFALIWAIIIMAPTLLIGNRQIYYIYESVAAVAVLLAMCLDRGLPGRGSLLSAWTLALLLIGVNGYATNKNAEVQWWKGAQVISEKVNEQVFAPNRGSPIRSLTIITPTPRLAEVVTWLINPGAFPEQLMMPRILMSREIKEFKVVTAEMYSRQDWRPQGAWDIVYGLDAGTPEYSFSRVEPMKLSSCNSFESGLGNLDSGWVKNTRTAYRANTNPAYVSQGRQSIWVSVASESPVGPRYGGITLPLTPSREFTLDLWVDKPQNLVSVFAYEMDDQGYAINAWVNNDPVNSLTAGAMNALMFQLNTGNVHGFDWTPQNPGGAPKSLHFFVDVKQGKQVHFYIDRLCELTEWP